MSASFKRPPARAGKAWEVEFEALCNAQGIVPLRIPDGCRVVGAGHVIRVKTPFDYCLFYGTQVLFCDAKTTQQGTFSHAKINDSQLDALLIPHAFGQRAGYVVQFRSKGVTVFYDAATLLGAKNARRSLKPSEGIELESKDQRDFLRAFR